VKLALFAATDGPDTDFIAKLVDVYPDGYEASLRPFCEDQTPLSSTLPMNYRLQSPGGQSLIRF